MVDARNIEDGAAIAAEPATPRTSAARRARDFLLRLDARALLVTACLILGAIAIVSSAREGLPADWADRVRRLFSAAEAEPWALFVVIAIYVAGAVIGAPQFLLIGATVAVFGAAQGAGFAWAATMVSASVTYLFGRIAGAGLLRRHGGDRLNALTAWVGRKGLTASLLLRVTPTAPFVVVNACVGAAGAPFWKYALGTAVGIIPKIAAVAFLGAGVSAWARSQSLLAAGLILAAGAFWCALVLWGRRATRRVRGKP